MAHADPQDVSIMVSANEVTTMGRVIADIWTKQRAFRLGLRSCLIAWLGALVTLPIPGLHFVAVPACLFIGPPLGYVIYKFYNGSTEILSGTGTCPACKTEWQMTKQTVDWPQITTCAHCRVELKIEPAAKT